MPLSHVSKIYAVTDCKIAKLTADPAGGTATYATAVDLPGVKSLAISGSIENKTLRGDNTLLDSDSTLTEVTGTIEHAKISLDVLAAQLGLTVADAGTTPNQTSTLDMTNTAKPAAFKVTAISATSDSVGGNVLYTLHKCILSGFPDLGLAEEDYQGFSFEFQCVPLLANGKWLTLSLNETAAAA
jgi:hypothetical protein